jgi:thiol-disulfide isomerase/thioredoxin
MVEWTPDDLKSNLDGGKDVFLKLWKKGCGPCKMSKPATDRLEEANPHGLTFAQICIDDHPEMLEISDSEVLPAFFVFKEQSMKGKYLGFKGIKKLEEFIESCV